MRVRSSHQPFGTVTLQLYISIPLNSVRAILVIAATQFFNRILARDFFKRSYAHPSNTCLRFRQTTCFRTHVRNLHFLIALLPFIQSSRRTNILTQVCLLLDFLIALLPFIQSSRRTNIPPSSDPFVLRYAYH